MQLLSCDKTVIILWRHCLRDPRGQLSFPYNQPNFTHRLSFHPFGCQRAGGDGRSAAKGFELGVHNLTVVIHLDLKAAADNDDINRSSSADDPSSLAVPGLLTWSFITSPQAGAPTIPVPTFLAFLSNEPTFLGFS